MKNNEKIKVESPSDDPNILIINGEKYIVDRVSTKIIDGIVHNDKVIFKKLDEEIIKKDMVLVINELSKKTDVKEMLYELLKEIPAKQLRRLAKRIKEKKPVKKQKGCLGFRIGNDAYIHLID